jgi:hypothetical protein
MLRIRFVKLDDERHRLELVRPDGARECKDLETRSFLLHDLTHYAVEAEVPIADGVWGTLAGGLPLARLNPAMGPVGGAGIDAAESIVGPMSSIFRGRPNDRVARDLARRVNARLRRLFGAWRAVPVGGALELTWPPAPPGGADAPVVTDARGRLV